MAKSVYEQIEKFFKIRANIDGAGWYRKIHGTPIVKWFDSHPQPQERNEWEYVGPDSDITTVEDGIAKDAKTKLEDLFSSIIDQQSFATTDYNRLRELLVDLYASHRTLADVSIQASDPHSLSNSDLDELFRSFGYLYSTQLRSFDENPLEQKVQFFLDLVNLYKVKGTPQSLVDVLQYYGVTEVDIYEFFLKLEDESTLFFEGKAVAGTTVNPTDIQVPYPNLTQSDPHWMYTEEQILQLNRQLDINLPSKTPYIGVQPIVDVDGAEMSILVRLVQDQFDYYESTGELPIANAEISYIGEVRTLLELYLSTVYVFNGLFTVGADATSFICYDGTNTNTVDIVAEYDYITRRPTTRAGQKAQLEEYYDTFTRHTSTNFLVDRDSAGDWLTIIAPDIKALYDSAGEPLELLYSLLRDLAIWVRSNLGSGFIDFGFILFGINEFFNELKPVIDFFKPYRARLLLLESLQVKNRLFNTIIIEDDASVGVDLQFHDFLTGDSIACCGDDVDIDSTSPIVCEGGESSECTRQDDSTSTILVWKGLWIDGSMYAVGDGVPDQYNSHYVCKVSHIAGQAVKPGIGVDWTIYWTLISQISCVDTTGATYYSRDTYDCGSGYDYGAVVDQEVFVEIQDSIYDHMRCPVSDTTGFVVSEITELSYGNSESIADGTSLIVVNVAGPTSDDYSISLSLKNLSGSASIYNYLVKNKTASGFQVLLSSPTDSANYYLDWEIVYDSTNAGITNLLPMDSTEVTISLPSGFVCPAADYSVAVALINNADSFPSVYAFDIIEKTATDFKVRFSSPLDSGNYFVDWSVCAIGTTGYYNIPNAVSQVTIPVTGQTGGTYPLIANIVAEGLPAASSIYSIVIIDKQETYFTLQLSSPTDSGDYYISWMIFPPSPENITGMTYYQSGGFRDFDGVPSTSYPIYDGTTFVGYGAEPGSEGTFDCTHGFDLCFIEVTEVTPPVEGNLLLTEAGGYLTQENDGGIIY